MLGGGVVVPPRSLRSKGRGVALRSQAVDNDDVPGEPTIRSAVPSLNGAGSLATQRQRHCRPCRVVAGRSERTGLGSGGKRAEAGRQVSPPPELLFQETSDATLQCSHDVTTIS